MVFVLMAVVPFVLKSDFVLSIATFIVIYSIVALSWNLLVGYSGQLSFGHHGFFLVGAYTSAIFVKTVGLPFLAGLAAGGVAATVAGIVIGFPAVRLKGFYLGMVTIAFAESLNLITRYLPSITGGEYGFSGIPKVSIGGFVFSSALSYYYMTLIVCFLLFLFAQNLLRSRFGYGLQALRSDEVVATSTGVNITIAKLQIFALSACYTGIAGCLYAFFVRFIAPDVFTLKFQVMIFAMSVLGGLVSIWGAIIGAAVYTVLPQVVGAFEDWYYVIWGLTIILVLAFMPRGVYPSLAHLLRAKIQKIEPGNNPG
jgi:branched-chain amino acid transport system permease protein